MLRLKKICRRFGSVFLASIGPSLLLLASWHSEVGRRIALWLFFVGCVTSVAFAFRSGPTASETDSQTPLREWRTRFRQVAVVLLFAWLCFSFICLLLTDPDRTVCIFLALGMFVSALCIVPFYSLATGWQLAAVVFT